MTDEVDALDTLKRVAVFRDADEEDLRLLAANGVPRAVEEGGYFFFQGDPADHFFILTSGMAKLCQITVDGQQVNLRTLFPHQVFGAVGAVDPSRVYPACAQALEDCSALAFPSAALRAVVQKTPEVSFGMMRLMTGYIQEMQERFSELASEDVEQRVASALLRLAGQFGRRTDEGLLVELAFTRQDLAEMTGTTLYTVSRILSAWEKSKIITASRKRVTLLDPHALVRLADGIP